jgi:transcriptional regulator with PAS, ATPase and Fis domain
MRTLIFDESLDISPQIHGMLAAREAETTFVCSPYEFQLAEASHGPADLRIINLTENLSAWEISRQLRASISQGLTLVLVAGDANPGLEHLAGLPGVECVERPGTQADLEAVVSRAVARARSPLPPGDPERSSAAEFSTEIIGQSLRLREVLAKIEKVAAGDANACIVGESGTGKELIARAIHSNSPRRDRPLITLDCTAVPEGLMESHLFGHLRGSFTGAVENRDGVFSLAHTGTLFIDEISELPLPLQAKLLRVIQTREFVKVGGTKPIRTDIRLITASNKDLRKAVEQGTFRGDLYYRIAVVMIQMPPLRERREDISALVDHFLTKFSASHRKRIRGITREALELLTFYHWPGNVRQLENCIEQAVVLCEGEMIDVEVLPLADTAPKRPVETGLAMRSGLTLREVEQRYILRTLREVGGNRTRAARILGISLRCLQYKLKAYAEGGTDHDGHPSGDGEPRELLGVRP